MAEIEKLVKMTGMTADGRGNRPEEKMKPPYVSRVLRLTLLTPEMVEEILDGVPTAEVPLSALMLSVPVE